MKNLTPSGTNIRKIYLHYANKLALSLLFLWLPVTGQTTTIHDIQYSTIQGSGDNCYPSSYNNQTVTVSGIVTGVQQGNYPDFFLQDGSGPWNGIYVYDEFVDPQIGDSITITGLVSEYYGFTEMKQISYDTTLSTNHSAPEPRSMTTGTFGTGCSGTAEPYEGVLVTFHNVEVTSAPDANGRWRGTDGTGECTFDRLMYTSSPNAGDTFESVTGIVFYTWGEYRINPRSSNDLVRSNYAPVIDSVIVYPDTPRPDDSVSIQAYLHDPDGTVTDVTLEYGPNGTYDSAAVMENTAEHRWSYTIYPQFENQQFIYCRLEAVDDAGYSTLSEPFTFLVLSDQVYGDTISVMSWNILNFPNASGAGRVPYLRTVLEYSLPTILVVQEIQSLSGVNTFLSDVLNHSGENYLHAPWNDGPDTDNMLFYIPGPITLDSTRIIYTSLRNIAVYYMKTNTNNRFVIYSLHLKAGSDTDDEQQRLTEINQLLYHVNSLPENVPVLVCGDFNVYSSSEPAYQQIITNSHHPFFDPLNMPGFWHTNSSFASIHTQSTRSTQEPDGGTPGGLDDRFDFILPSELIDAGISIKYLSNTYETIGNDGLHYNQSINAGTNAAVPAEIANALFYASDHLPVVAKFVIQGQTSIYHPPVPVDHRLKLVAYPNPFNSSITIKIPQSDQRQVMNVFDLGGRLVFSHEFRPGAHHEESYSWPGLDNNRTPLPSGIYFVTIDAGSWSLTGKIVLLK